MPPLFYPRPATPRVKSGAPGQLKTGKRSPVAPVEVPLGRGGFSLDGGDPERLHHWSGPRRMPGGRLRGDWAPGADTPPSRSSGLKGGWCSASTPGSTEVDGSATGTRPWWVYCSSGGMWGDLKRAPSPGYYPSGEGSNPNSPIGIASSMSMIGMPSSTG